MDDPSFTTSTSSPSLYTFEMLATKRPPSVPLFTQTSSSSSPLSTPFAVAEVNGGGGGGPCPEHGRCRFTVLSWNVLAQCLIHRSMYPKATSMTLRWKHRFSLLKHYLRALNPSIVCLQEVDPMEGPFETFLKEAGYTTELVQKQHGQHKCSISWKSNVFLSIEKSQTIVLTPPCLFHATDPSLGSVASLKQQEETETKENEGGWVKTKKSLEDIDEKRLGQTALIVTLLHRATHQKIMVSNHHLFWAPHGAYLRLHQLNMLLNLIQETNHENVPVFLCGDFNCLPTSAEYRVLTKASLNEEHLQSLRDSYPQGKDEVTLMNLVYEFQSYPKFHSVYENYQRFVLNLESIGTCSSFSFSNENNTLDKQTHPSPGPDPTCVKGEPEFTNFTEPFQGTLDYIFWSTPPSLSTPPKQVAIHHLLKIPDSKELTTPDEIALPNLRFPSDHLPIMAEIELS